MRELASHMRSRGFKVSSRTLYYLLRGGPVRHTPYDRTLYKIRNYLDHVRRHKRRSRPGSSSSSSNGARV